MLYSLYYPLIILLHLGWIEKQDTPGWLTQAKFPLSGAEVYNRGTVYHYFNINDKLGFPVLPSRIFWGRRKHFPIPTKEWGRGAFSIPFHMTTKASARYRALSLSPVQLTIPWDFSKPCGSIRTVKWPRDPKPRDRNIYFAHGAMCCTVQGGYKVLWTQPFPQPPNHNPPWYILYVYVNVYNLILWQ